MNVLERVLIEDADREHGEYRTERLLLKAWDRLHFERMNTIVQGATA